MTTTIARRNRLWSIVLAGGEGERIRPVVESWLGRRLPKQYCTFVGTRSLFQHTLDRADSLSTSEHRVTVMAKTHRQHAHTQFQKRESGKVLLQPANRGTTAGIILPLTYVRAIDPNATVVIYPSDHFVYPEEGFIEHVDRAVWMAELLPDRIILLGVRPDSAEQEYGWVEPGADLCRDYQLREVELFVEKPRRPEACALLARGGLWNTMVIVSKVRKLWEVAVRRFPDMMALFEAFSGAIGSAKEAETLESIYNFMPEADFSRGILEHIPEQIAVLELRDVLWSDWGRAERIINTLHRIDKKPNFLSAACAAG